MKSVFATLLATSALFPVAIAGQGQPEEPPPPVEGPTVAKRGDVITLRSGKSLQGVRVLSDTQLEVTVEVLPGLPPLKLPASQVTSIEYGQPLDSSLLSEAPELMNVDGGDKDSILLPAHRLELAFSKRLEEEMGEALAGEAEGDVVDILKRVAKTKAIHIEFDRDVLSRSRAQRQSAILVEKDHTLDTFLRVSVPTSVTWLQIRYEFDRVVVSLKGNSENGDRAEMQIEKHTQPGG